MHELPNRCPIKKAVRTQDKLVSKNYDLYLLLLLKHLRPHRLKPRHTYVNVLVCMIICVYRSSSLLQRLFNVGEPSNINTELNVVGVFVH